MKMLRKLLFAIAAVGLLATVSAPPAEAALVRMCAPSSDTTASKRVVNPNTNVAYTFGARGCALISPLDIGYFLSQGYVVDPPSAIAYKFVAANSSIILPPAAYIDSITVQETSAAAVTGGLKIGTTAGGTDVVAAATCGASCLITITDVSLLKRVFSATAPQQLFMGAVTNFNSGPEITVTVHYSYF